MLNPTVLTAGQEREQRGSFMLGSSWNGKGTHMWRLRQEKPELFDRREQGLTAPVQIDTRPLGFESCHMEGWLYNKEKTCYLEQSTNQLYWWDEVTQTHRQLREGEVWPVAFTGGAASSGAGVSEMNDPKQQQQPQQHPAPKHILISDIHGAAKALKMHFDHLDRPAAALALVGAPLDNTGTNPVAPPDAVARILPEKLLKRLTAFRGEWSDDMLAGVLASALADVATSLGALAPAAAVALAVGQRTVVAASPARRSPARCCTYHLAW